MNQILVTILLASSLLLTGCGGGGSDDATRDDATIQPAAQEPIIPGETFSLSTIGSYDCNDLTWQGGMITVNLAVPYSDAIDPNSFVIQTLENGYQATVSYPAVFQRGTAVYSIQELIPVSQNNHYENRKITINLFYVYNGVYKAYTGYCWQPKKEREES
jgi:hypothetical protein